MFDDDFFYVVAAAKHAGEMQFVASRLEVVERLTASGARHRKASTVSCIQARGSDVRRAAAWYWVDGRDAVVLTM